MECDGGHITRDTIPTNPRTSRGSPGRHRGRGFNVSALGDPDPACLPACLPGLRILRSTVADAASNRPPWAAQHP